MRWDLFLKAGSALAMYVALMCGFIAGINPVGYALFTAIVLALGLSVQAIGTPDLRTSIPSKAKTANPENALLPSLGESMAELHALQRDINTLQAQFTAENAERSSIANQDDSNS